MNTLISNPDIANFILNTQSALIYKNSLLLGLKIQLCH